MVTGFTSRRITDACTYFIKALYYRLLMAVRKHIYNRCYPSVLCLYCDEKTLFGLSLSFLSVLQLLSICALDFLEAVFIFYDPKVAGIKIADFVYSLCITFRNNIWLVHAKHHAYMKKNGLIPVDGSIPVSVSGLVSRFSDSVVKLLGITEAFGIRFGFHKSCSFF
ncbi:hypothetical protein G9A89_004283 [Geosiphon pyriformis]|nr:hypothetical protein G9A89_004283 [Geosiphon pyriformis]